MPVWRCQRNSLNIQTGHLVNILNMVEQLSELNTDDIEPLANVVDMEAKMRADVVDDGDIQDKVLANAPEDSQGFFVVPKVVESGA